VRTLEITSIVIAPDRQRQDNKKSKDLASLKKSILTKGLLHPPVISNGEATATLVAGERRLLSCKELHEDGLTFLFDGQPVPKDHIPYTLIGELEPADLEEAELEENILRANLNWPEECAAKLKIHEMRKAKNPDQRLMDTAQEIVNVVAGGKIEPVNEARKLSIAQTVLAHITSPEVAQSKTLTAAYRKVIDRKIATLNRELLQVTPSLSKHKIILGDCRNIMPVLDKGYYDLILSDPPYGIKANKMAQEMKHDYDDSPANALSIYQEILRNGFNLLRTKGSMFLFCDIEHFLTIRTFAEQQAFSTWRTPIIWHKGSEGFAPWGTNGFIRTYETILFCVKGENSLVLNGGPDVRTIKRVQRQDRTHAAEKPPELLRWLLEISCRREARVLDPCCGSGPIIPAASGLGLEITGIEIEEKAYETALTRLSASESEVPESVVSHPETVDDITERILKRKL
jgi:adenine-specific DNA-methyltransferase